MSVFDRFKAASPNQQLLLAAGGICLLAALLFFGWFSLLRTTYQPLFTDLKMNDASTIVAELGRKKVPYRLANGGATILVPSGMVDSARLDVMGGDIPLKGSVGFELFNKSDMGLTDFAQKINYQRALQGELERTIMTLDGVDTARVHLSLGEDRLFRDDQVAPKASVTIRMARDSHLSESAAQGVKRLVAAAVPKMDVSDVVILDERGQAVSVPTASLGSTKPTSPLAEQKRAIEEYYDGRIREAFAQSRLPANISVSVTAETVATVVDGARLSDWAPAARNFPLQITLSSPAPVTPEVQDTIRLLLDKNIGVSAARNDVIMFTGASPGIETNSIDMSAGVAAARHRPIAALFGKGEDENGIAFEWALVAVPMLVVLLAGFLLILKLRGPRRLSAKRQADFVERIRAALEEKDSRATSRS